MSGNVIGISTSALVGAALAPTPALATVPLGIQFFSTMLTTIPASLLMGKVGRRPGFMLGALFGLLGAVLTTAAIINSAFWLFCAGTVFLGVFNGFGGFYRFAAAEAASDEYRSRAVSYVLAGGVVAAVAGPNLARWSRDLLSTEFAGSYALLLALYIPALILPVFLRLAKPAEVALQAAGRPLMQIVRQPVFIVAVLSGMVGYSVMSLLMTAAPLAMKEHDHGFSSTAFVIQWHVLGMFLPSFVTGHLIARLGVLRVILAGALLGAGAVGSALAGVVVGNFLISLFLLGIGWNFMFVGATTLLTESYRPIERAKTQALNDFLVFGAAALASLSAGALQNAYSWSAVNMGVVPLLVVLLVSLGWLAYRGRGTRPGQLGAPQADS